MKYFLSLSVSVSVLCISLSAVEYGRLTTTPSQLESESVDLAEGDIFEVIHYSGGGLNHIIDETTGASFTYDYHDLDLSAQDYGFRNINSERIIVGPGRIFLVHPAVNVGFNYYCSYKLTRKSEIDTKSVAILSIPSESVSSGNLSLVLEGSDDLESWDLIHTSQLSGSTQAFFRTAIKTIAE